MWMNMEEDLRIKDMKNNNHITHWNNEYTRGTRLDRVYLNFETDLKMDVSSHTHVGADHKAVRWSLSTRVHTPNVIERKTPHRAYAIPEVAQAVREVFLKEFPAALNDNHRNLLARWDRTKGKAKKAAWETWSSIVRQRGKEKKKALRKYERALLDLVSSNPVSSK